MGRGGGGERVVSCSFQFCSMQRITIVCGGAKCQ